MAARRMAATACTGDRTIRNISALVIALLVIVSPVGARAKADAASQTMPYCPASDPVVWINTNSKIFHVQGDHYFGKTKAGVYACTSKAIASGARAAEEGFKHPGSSSASPQVLTPVGSTKPHFTWTRPTATPIATAAPIATPTPVHRRHHRRSPSPQPTDL